MNELKLYTLSQKYFKYIKQFDKRVPSVAAGKDKRPFIGVVLEINGCLRNVIDKPEKRHLRERCCDFPLLEKKCLEYENGVTKTIEKTKQIDLE